MSSSLTGVPCANTVDSAHDHEPVYTFKQLFADFIAGAPIKCKTWGGYWKYRLGEIEMHGKDGTVEKFTGPEDILFTVAGILQYDWEYATDNNCGIPVK